MELIRLIKSDFNANSGNSKGKAVMLFYRIANYSSQHRYLVVKLLGFPFVKLYHWFFIWLMGIEIPEKTQIGEGLQVWHGTALVINAKAVIGKNVLLRHCTTIGNKGPMADFSPVIGDNVDIGCNSVLVGKIVIGNNVSIGAGSIVTKSIPANSVAYGNPLKIIPKNEAINGKG